MSGVVVEDDSVVVGSIRRRSVLGIAAELFASDGPTLREDGTAAAGSVSSETMESNEMNMDVRRT